MRLFTPVIDVKHRPYCGPAAIAALTGVPVARIEKMLRRGRKGYRDSDGRKIPIKGTHPWEVIKVLERLGCKVTEVKPAVSTFGRFVEDTVHVRTPYLVEVTGHFMATHQGSFCDTSSLEGPRALAGYRRATRRVQRVWEVEAPAEPKYTLADPIAPPPRAPKPKRDIKQVRMARLAAQIAEWESRERRAKNALKKLRPKLRRYERIGVAAPSRIALPVESEREADKRIAAEKENP